MQILKYSKMLYTTPFIYRGDIEKTAGIYTKKFFETDFYPETFLKNSGKALKKFQKKKDA
jgi:hypothetical protein